MSNQFYNYTSGQPTAISRGTSSALRSEFALIGAGFEQIGKVGMTWLGAHDFTVGAIKVPTLAPGASGSFAASVDYVNAMALSTVLPGQTGNAGKVLTTDGITATFKAIGIFDDTTRLAQAQAAALSF